jgi:hypothetical protein
MRAEVLSIDEFYKSESQVKPFTRTRKGKMEHVGGFTRKNPDAKLTHKQIAAKYGLSEDDWAIDDIKRFGKKEVDEQSKIGRQVSRSEKKDVGESKKEHSQVPTKTEKRWSSRDFVVTREIESDDWDEPREVAAVNVNIDPEEARTRDYPGAPAQITDVTYVWAKTGKELTSQEYDKYIEGEEENQFHKQIMEEEGDRPTRRRTSHGSFLRR